jgi:hypothetical protein
MRKKYNFLDRSAPGKGFPGTESNFSVWNKNNVHILKIFPDFLAAGVGEPR